MGRDSEAGRDLRLGLMAFQNGLLGRASLIEA